MFNHNDRGCSTFRTAARLIRQLAAAEKSEESIPCRCGTGEPCAKHIAPKPNATLSMSQVCDPSNFDLPEGTKVFTVQDVIDALKSRNQRPAKTTRGRAQAYGVVARQFGPVTGCQERPQAFVEYTGLPPY